MSVVLIIHLRSFVNYSLKVPGEQGWVETPLGPGAVSDSGP